MFTPPPLKLNSQPMWLCNNLTPATWGCTKWRSILKKSHTSAANVNIQRLTPAIWGGTKEPTQGKNFTDAQHANFPALQPFIWKITWWDTIQEKNLTKGIQYNYVCASSSQLQSHMRNHKGLRPFQCNQCSTTFKWNTSLLNHVKIHIGAD